MKFLVTDHDFPDLDLEMALFREAGMDAVAARCRTEDDVIAAGKGCSGLLTQYAPMNAKVFAALPEVRVVSRMGAGFDTVNVEDAKRHGVWVANSPDYGVGEVATHALGMALSLVRHLPFYDRDVRAANWHYTSAGKLRRVANMTIGLLGLGRIGKRLAQLSQPVFGRIVACDPYIAESDFPSYVKRVSLEELFRESDVVSAHVPLNDETRGMIDLRKLSLMKQGSFLVNTARGSVANLGDVLKGLDSGRLEAAALDVLPKEPPEADHPVLRHPRVLLTPHAAFYSVEGEKELRTKAAQNLVDWAKTGRPTYVVSEGETVSPPSPRPSPKGEGA